MEPHEAVAAAVRAEIEKVRAQYLSGLPAEVEGLAALCGRLAGEASDRAALEELRHRLHRIAGSGGTFGLSALSEHARRLEKDIDRWLAGASLPAAAERQDLCSGIAALKPLLAADPADGSTRGVS